MSQTLSVSAPPSWKNLEKGASILFKGAVIEGVKRRRNNQAVRWGFWRDSKQLKNVAWLAATIAHQPNR
jgi:hypothetical protein